MMLKLRILIALVVLALAGCVTFKEISDTTKLKKFPIAADGYAKAIRWSDFESASFYAKHLKASIDLGGLKAFKVTAYEVKEIVHKKSELKVLRTVEINYYNKANLTEKSQRYQEEWIWDDRDRAWYLGSGFPEFR